MGATLYERANRKIRKLTSELEEISEAVKTLLDLDDQQSLTLTSYCESEEFYRLDEAMKTLRAHFKEESCPDTAKHPTTGS